MLTKLFAKKQPAQPSDGFEFVTDNVWVRKTKVGEGIHRLEYRGSPEAISAHQKRVEARPIKKSEMEAYNLALRYIDARERNKRMDADPEQLELGFTLMGTSNNTVLTR